MFLQKYHKFKMDTIILLTATKIDNLPSLFLMQVKKIILQKFMSEEKFTTKFKLIE
jgi:hypothetical protein